MISEVRVTHSYQNPNSGVWYYSIWAGLSTDYLLLQWQYNRPCVIRAIFDDWPCVVHFIDQGPLARDTERRMSSIEEALQFLEEGK